MTRPRRCDCRPTVLTDIQDMRAVFSLVLTIGSGNRAKRSFLNQRLVFQCTRVDLNDCLDTIRRDERLSEMEALAGRNMLLEFLSFCRDYDIIDDYDGQLVHELFQNLKEREICEED